MSKTWSSHHLFILASIGSAVGLSNIWRFTYLAGANGGGAFVLIYLGSLLLMGIPILAAEMMLGRRGRQSMTGTMELLASHDGIHAGWRIFGWVAAATVFLVLSYYCVIAGWTIDYTVTSLTGYLSVQDAASASAFFDDLMADPWRMMLGQATFVIATTAIVALGIHRGLEQSVRWMMPALFAILLALVLYSAIAADIGSALRFLFYPDFSKINASVVMAAFGQAFFSLGIGVGVMLTYGAYMPEKSRVLPSAIVIALSDGLASVLAGLAIFPVVFQYDLTPGEGPGLIFKTLPIAFGEMPGGNFVGALFFLLLVFAALTSSISLLESVIVPLEEKLGIKRKTLALLAGSGLWCLGILSVLSFNRLSTFRPVADRNLFELFDYACSNLIMPICGILMAVLAGWLTNPERTFENLGTTRGYFIMWQALVRFVAPAAVAGIFLSNL